MHFSTLLTRGIGQQPTAVYMNGTWLRDCGPISDTITTAHCSGRKEPPRLSSVSSQVDWHEELGSRSTHNKTAFLCQSCRLSLLFEVFTHNNLSCFGIDMLFIALLHIVCISERAHPIRRTNGKSVQESAKILSLGSYYLRHSMFSPDARSEINNSGST